MTLNTYLTSVQNILGTSSSSTIYATGTLIGYINEARRQVAERGQCVRALTPVAGPISTIAIVTSGSGYAGVPTVTITPPDFPTGFLPSPTGLAASALASGMIGAACTIINVQSTGAGYFSPGITITGGSISATGVQATAIATVSGVTATVQGQEQYPFSMFLSNLQSPISGYSGIANVLAVKSVSVIWGTFRYTMNMVSFSKYQARVRTYSNQWQDVPAVGSQYGQGVTGTLFLYPVPNAPYQLEADCICEPVDLVDDNTFEAIPSPWHDAIKYYAAYLAMMQKQRFSDAKIYFNEGGQQGEGLFQQSLKKARRTAEPGNVTSWYGRF